MDLVGHSSVVRSNARRRSTACRGGRALCLLLAVAFTLVAHAPRLPAEEFFEPVLDIDTRTASSYPTGFFVYGEQLLFTAWDANAWKLWSLDLVTDEIEELATVRLLGSGSFVNPAPFVEAGGVLFFAGETREAGAELWKTDGTPEGTILVADIAPGESSSEPAGLIALADLLYFMVNDELDSPVRVWTSDGSEAGTVPSEALEEAGIAVMFETTTSGERFYFTELDSSTAPYVFSSDGTAAGTETLARIRLGEFLDGVHFTPHAGGVFFVSTDWSTGSPFELRYSDGTAAGTVVVDEASSLELTSPEIWFEHDGWVYFTADEDSVGRELWRASMPAGVTELVADIFPDEEGSNPTAPLLHEGYIYFAATGDGIGQELWRTDGTAAGTELVADVDAAASSWPRPLASALGEVYFTAHDTSLGDYLWRTDDGPDGFVPVMALEPSKGTRLESPLVEFDGYVWFALGLNSTGIELWRSDGTESGTTILEIGAGSMGAVVSHTLLVAGGRLFFTAYDDSHGEELWAVDAGDPEPYLFVDSNLGTSNGASRFLAANDDMMFFTAGTAETGIELWKSDGTADGTLPVADIRPGPTTSMIREGAVSGSKLVFSATGELAGASTGFEPWTSDGSEAGTVQLADLWPGSGWSDPRGFVEFDGEVFFVATSDIYGRELWRTDLSQEGTVLVEDLIPGAESSNPTIPSVQNGRLLWSTSPVSGNSALWSLTDREADPELVYAGSGQGAFIAGQLHAFAGDWYFAASTEDAGRELWKTGGTTSSTKLVVDLLPGDNPDGTAASSFPSRFTRFGDLLLFHARDEEGELGIWRTDGTADGTNFIAYASSHPYLDHVPVIAAFGDHAYFTVITMDNTTQLVRTDGTALGTEVVKEFDRQSFPQPFASFAEYRGKLYFDAFTHETGYKVWATDGTEAGTVLVGEAATGPAEGTSPIHLTVFRDRLYAITHSNAVGAELHVLVQREDFLRGDADGDGQVAAILDFFYIVGWRFLGGPAPPCYDAADFDDDDRAGTLQDAILLLSWGFLGGADPPPPGPYECGTDGDDDPGCASASSGCD